MQEQALADVLIFYPQLCILSAMGKEVYHQVKGCTSLTYARGMVVLQHRSVCCQCRCWNDHLQNSQGWRKVIRGFSQGSENLKNCPLRCAVYLGTRKAGQNRDKEKQWKTLWAKPSILVKEIEHCSVKKHMMTCFCSDYKYGQSREMPKNGSVSDAVKQAKIYPMLTEYTIIED